mmetsp:Transcript_18128/g.54756  ORF Transcript_18128/g.54756 Transcript_18128/m.54756 type:complete len:224 (+) Transcript_18128:1050-1721(+)
MTERSATPMPLITMITSGTARSSFAIRAMRVILSSRIVRKRVVSPSARPLLAPPKQRKVNGKSQVSRTIRSTRARSKANQGSLKTFRFTLNAKKRMHNSPKKYVQKKLSATMKTVSESATPEATFSSQSTAIQHALTKITTSVRYSKHTCLATAWDQPRVWKKLVMSCCGLAIALRTCSFISVASAKTARCLTTGPSEETCVLIGGALTDIPSSFRPADLLPF